VFSDGLGFS